MSGIARRTTSWRASKPWWTSKSPSWLISEWRMSWTVSVEAIKTPPTPYWILLP